MPQDLYDKYAVSPDQVMGDAPMPLETREQTREYLEDMSGRGGQQESAHPIHDMLRQQNGGTLPGADVTGQSNYRLSGDTEFGDYTKGVGKGFVDILGSLAGAVEATGMVEGGTLTRAIEQYGEDIVKNMTPSAQANMRREWTDMTRNGALANPKAMLQQFMTVLPSLATSMGVAGVAGKTALAAHAARAGGTLTKAQKIATAGKAGAVAAGAWEAPQIAGATINELRGAMDGMSHGELVEFSPEYRKLYKQHGGEAEARQALLMKAGQGPAAVNGILGAMIATVPGAMWGRIMNKATTPTSLKRHFGKTFAAEAGEEIGQEGIAGMTTGQAETDYLDYRHDPMEGMGERLTAAGALGGMGGLAGGAVTAGGRNNDLPRRENDVDPAVQAAIQLAMPLEGGEGGAPTGAPGQMELFDEAAAPDGPGGNLTGDEESPFQGQLDFFTAPEPEAPGQMEMDFPPEQMALDLTGTQPEEAVGALPAGDEGQLDMFGNASAGPGPGVMVGEGELQPQHPVRQGRTEPIPGQPRLPNLPPGQQDTQPVMDLQGGEMNAPTPGPTAPEPIADIEAQVEQMLDPDTEKTAVYISPIDIDENQANPYWAARAKRVRETVADMLNALVGDAALEQQEELMPTQGVPGQTGQVLVKGEGLEVFKDRDGGLVISTDPAKLEVYRNGYQDEAARGTLLDYPQSKEELPNPDDTVTFEVVNPDGSVADTFVLENTPDAIEMVHTAIANRKRGGRLREGQEIRVQPTGVALQGRMARAEEEYGNLIPTDMQMGLPFAGGQQKTLDEAPPTKAEKKVKAKAETKRRGAAAEAITEGIAEGVEKGTAAEDFATRQKARQYKEETKEPPPKPEPKQDPRKMELAKLQVERDEFQAVVDDKARPFKERNAAIQSREALNDAIAKLEARIIKEDAAAAEAKADKQGDLFGDGGKLPAGTYTEVPYSTAEGGAQRARVTPSKRDNPPVALMSEGGEDIKLDQAAPKPAAADEWRKRPKKGRKQEQKKLPLWGGAVGKAPDGKITTRATAQARAKAASLARAAKRKLGSKRQIAGVRGHLKRKVEGGREQATNQEVRALETLQGKQAPTKSQTAAEDVKLASQLRELRKAINGLLQSRYGMSEAEAIRFAGKHLDKSMLRGLSSGKAGRQEVNRLLKRGGLGTPEGFNRLMTLMNDNIRDAVGAAAIQSAVGGPISSARSLLDTWKGNFGTYKTEQARRDAQDDLLNSPSTDKELASIYGMDLDAVYTGKKSSPWSTKGEAKLTKKASTELEKLIAEQAAADQGFEPVTEGDALSVAEGDIDLSMVDTPIAVTAKGKNIYGRTVSAVQAEGKANEKAAKKARAKRPKSLADVEAEAVSGAIEDARPDHSRGQTSGDGRGRTTSFDGQDGGVRSPDGASITPASGPKRSAVTKFIKSHFPDLADQIGQHQLDGIGYMLQRMEKTPDGSYMLNGDGAGVGKTLELLVLAAIVESRGGKVLYVTPNKDVWSSTVKQAEDFGVYPGNRTKANINTRQPLSKGVQAAGYSTLGNFAGQEFDLVIYDEAHKLRNPETLAAADARSVKAKHTVFATATMADKAEFLSLLALVDGRVNQDGSVDVEAFIKSLGAKLVTVKSELTGTSAPTIVGADVAFLQRLKDKLQKVSNRAGFFTRNLTRLSTPSTWEVDGGKSMNIGGAAPSVIEGRLTLAIEEEAAATGRKPDISKLINASTKLSELSKVSAVVADIKERIKAGEQAIVFSTYYNDATTDKTKGKLSFTLGGKKYDYALPSSLRIIKEELERDGIKVGTYFGSSNTTANEQFQAGDVQVILGTYAKMSEGISLDDKAGDVPRTQYHLAPDWSADVMAQSYARADRASTKSTPNIINVTSGFIADRKRGELLAIKERIRGLLAGEDVDLAYGPRNIQHGPITGGYTAKLWGVPTDTGTFKAVAKEMKKQGRKADVEGFYTFKNKQDYLQNGSWVFTTALTAANREAGLAPGFEQGELTTEQTDSAEGKPSAVESKDIDKLQPLLDRSDKVVDKLNEAEARLDAAQDGSKEYRNAAAQVRKWNRELVAVNDLIVAANEKNKAPAMLAPDTPVHMDYAQEFWNEAEAGETATVGSYIDGMPKGELNRAERRILTKLKNTVGDVPIVSVSTAEVEFATGIPGAVAAYDRVNNRILISGSAADVNEAYIHEAIHAAGHYAVDNSPGFRSAINRLIQQAGPALQPWLDTQTPEIRDRITAALGDVHEFLSYGLSDPVLSAQLDTIVNNDRSLLRRIYEAIMTYLGAGRKTTLLDTLTKQSLKNFSGQVSDAPLKHGTEQARAMLGAGARAVEPILQFVQRADTATVKAGAATGSRKFGLPMATLRQINTIYEQVLDKLNEAGEKVNPVRAWQDAMQKKNQIVKEFTVRGEEMYRDLQAVKAGYQEPAALDRLLQESTRLGLWANKSIDHKDNEHAAGKPALVAEHAVLHARYLDLKAHEQEMGHSDTVYERLESYYRKERESNFESAMVNIFYGLENVHYDQQGTHLPIKGEESRKKYAAGIRAGIYEADDFLMKSDNGDVNHQITRAINEGIRTNKAGMLAKGPYFPLKRFGEYGVSARRSKKAHSATLTAEDITKAEKYAAREVKKNHKKDPESDAAKRTYAEALQRSKDARLRITLSKLKEMRKGEEPVVELGAIEYNGHTATAESYVPYFSLHASRHEGIAVRDELVADGGWEEITDNVVRLQDNPGAMSSANSMLVEAIRGKLKAKGSESAALSHALEAALIQIMPETSVKHEQLNRRGVEGYFEDHSRALAAHVQSTAWYRGQLVEGRRVSDALARMSAAARRLEKQNPNFAGQQEEATKASEVIREIQKRAAIDADPQQLGKALQMMGDVGFVYMLFSPAYMAVNLTQPGMFGLPWLAARQRGGNMSASEALGNAYKTISGQIYARAKAGGKGMFSKDGIDPQLFDFLERNADSDEISLSGYVAERIREAAEGQKPTVKYAEGVIDMMTTLSERNVMDFTMASDISSAADGRTSKRQAVMDRFRILPHLTEVLNRSVMAMSAYEMGREQGMNHNTAVEFAERAVTETQFDYTMLNKPRWMSEQQFKMAKPIFMFMQHPQHVYAMFVQSVILGTAGSRRHTARQKNGTFDPNNAEHVADQRAFKENFGTIVGVLGTHMVMGGAVGAMFEPAKWALGMALLAFEKIEGEPPEETEVYVQRFLADVLGDDVGEVAAHGIGAAFGLHLSDNLSISGLALMNSPGRYNLDREGVKDGMFALAGPLPALIANAAEGAKTIGEGDILGGLAKMTPRVARDVFNAANLYTDGLQDSRGNTIVDKGQFTPLELFAESMGFRTRGKAKAYTNKAAIDTAKYFYAEQARVLRERLVRAKGSWKDTRAVVQDIRAYNAELPQGMRIKTTLSAGHANRQSMLQELGAIVTRDQRYLVDKMRVYDND